jgi:hypothetical protein
LNLSVRSVLMLCLVRVWSRLTICDGPFHRGSWICRGSRFVGTSRNRDGPDLSTDDPTNHLFFELVLPTAEVDGAAGGIMAVGKGSGRGVVHIAAHSSYHR